MENDVQLPEKGFAKVVQLFIGGRPVLRFGNADGWHSQILESALKEFNLSYQIQKIEGKIVPLLVGEKYQAVGMGMCNRHGSEILINGNSGDYEIGINKEHIEQCKSLIPKGIELIIIN